MGACCDPNDNCTYKLNSKCIDPSKFQANIDCRDSICQTPICTFTESEESEGSCLRVYDISIDGAPVSGIDYMTKLCLTYQMYTLRDRIMVLKTKGNPLYREAPAPGYDYSPQPSTCNSSFYYTYYSTNTLHPYLGVSSVSAQAAIIFDSLCINTPFGAVKQTITVDSSSVEMQNTTDPWYKKIRVFMFGACFGQNLSQYEFQFTCGECPSPLVQDTPIYIDVIISGTNIQMPVIDSPENLADNGVIL